MIYENLVDRVLPDSVWDSVISITKECASGLFLEPMSDSHPLFDYRLAVLVEEFNSYMIYTKSQMIDDVGRFSTGVVLAQDPENERAAGFILYSRDFHSDEVVGIIGIAVRKDYRLQGVMTAMIEKLRQSVRDISLSCSLDLVRAYHGLGFAVRGVTGAQVKMGWGGSGGVMAHFQAGSFDNVESVKVERNKLGEQLGNTYSLVVSDYIAFIQAETLKVNDFIQNWQADPTSLP